MNFIWNVELLELECEKDFYLAKNDNIWISVYIYDDWLNKNLKLDWIYIYWTLNARDWKTVNFWFSSLQKYNDFLYLRKNIKGTWTKLLSKFACLTKFEKQEVIKWTVKIKGLWGSNLEKIKKLIPLEEDVEIDEFNKIKEFLRDISDDEKKQEEFLKWNFDKIKGKDKSEILECFNKYNK